MTIYNERFSLAMPQKRVAVSMSKECAAILKEYCSFFDISQSDALYLFARSAIHKHSLHCKKVESLLRLRQKDLDKRSEKVCFGWACLICAYKPKCITGLYDGLFEPEAQCEHLFIKGPLSKVIEILENVK